MFEILITQMVRVNLWWSVVRVGEITEGSGTHHGDKIRLLLQVMDGGKWERLMEPQNQEISPRYILNYSTTGGSSIFQLFDPSERQDHFVANRKRWLESQGKDVAQQES